MIEDETEFCGEELLHSVLRCKVRLAWVWGEACGKVNGAFLVLFGGSVTLKSFPGDGKNP